MISTNYIMGFIGITLVGMWYEKWRKKTEEDQHIKDYELVKQYLINDSSLASSKKPILWIHVPTEINARHWRSFYSRNSTDVNRPYLYLTIKSIVDKCGHSFNVCLINDDSFRKIIPGWDIALDSVAKPTRQRLRQMALARTLYYFGGMVVPDSLLCFSDLEPVYNAALNCPGQAFVGELVDRSKTAEDYEYAPSTRIMGCKAGSKLMEEYDQYLGYIISKDYTSQPTFLGYWSNWWTEKVNAGQAGMISAKQLGAEVPHGPMTIEMLMGSTYYELSPECVALYIPKDELSERLNYRWFERQSPEQVLSGDYLIGLYFLAALANECGK